ncbi:transcription initiation factor Spt4 [Tieghemostelium lacteum]|uniref:Transcription initiation factor Spt4 n=1 Tax=Tieghemostelium lacteum TaxID=361077 RepID=A0A151ZHU0_TIELA|nr:transcription initiation factor Spt4 [Tieghemostelium lacteum]|eukprot:KYQ93533.1 transcription initiation factor Spt4 [Tieghemostelium lacteum]
MSSIVPSNFKKSRACLECGLVKTIEQFEETGCENCEDHTPMQGNKPAILQSTTATFEGLIAIMKPKESWIARRRGFEKRVPGCYALSTDADQTSSRNVTRY